MKRTLPFATKLNPTVQKAFLNQSLDSPPPHPPNKKYCIRSRYSTCHSGNIEQEHATLFKIVISTTYMISPAFNSNSGGGLTITYECPGLCWKSAALTELKNKNKNV